MTNNKIRVQIKAGTCFFAEVKNFAVCLKTFSLMVARFRQISDGGIHLQGEQHEQWRDLAVTHTHARTHSFYPLLNHVLYVVEQDENVQHQNSKEKKKSIMRVYMLNNEVPIKKHGILEYV